MHLGILFIFFNNLLLTVSINFGKKIVRNHLNIIYSALCLKNMHPIEIKVQQIHCSFIAVATFVRNKKAFVFKTIILLVKYAMETISCFYCNA